MLNLLLAAACLQQGPGTSTAPVVINEFCYDDGGTDNYEFVELFNRTGAPVDISGWKVVVNDSASPGYGGSGTGTVPTHVIPANTILAAGAFYLLGNVALVPTPVPGVSQTIPTNAIENGGTYTAVDFESIELQDPTGTIIDSLVYEMGYAAGPFGPHPLEGNGFFGDLACGDGNGLPAHSISRVLDGWDNNKNETDFLVGTYPTPGASNQRPAGIPYIETFDTGSIGATIPGWVGGFVLPKYVDPTIVDPENLNSKPASPQGGLALSMWDKTGGGNTIYYDMAPVQDVVVETFVWLDPVMTPVNPQTSPYVTGNPAAQSGVYNAGDGETWFLGVRGSANGNANPPNVSGTYYSEIALGVGLRHHFVTGIAWVHHRTTVSSRLFLVDLKDGASNANVNNFTILAGPIDILPGISDGWQRVRLHVQGNKVIGNFGGSYGFDNGQRFSATTTTNGFGQVYVGYREALLYNNNGTAGCHPPLFDLFDVHAPTTSQLFVGTGSPTTIGTPAIDSDGLAIVGSTGFAIKGSGMVPFGAPNGAFCGIVYGFSYFGPGYPIPGAPPTALGYVLPVLVSAISFAGPSGNVAFPFPLPPDYTLAGVPLVSQLIDFDLALPYGIPVGLSQGMETVIGF
ncbi:MAG: lamin tail domain-containing protein [Planctomycetes bacterium]|nr:lamin tail domain-containing protein [Planctomycetota bacterium]